MVRRFLSRSSISNRLVGLLVVSVVVPGLVLAWYGVQAVLQEETLYETTLRGRAKDVAAALHKDLGERMEALLAELDEGVAHSPWVTDPDAASVELGDAEPRVGSVLVLDEAGHLRHPRRAAGPLLGVAARARERSALGPLMRQAERLEVVDREYAAAADAYAAGAAAVPGRRGKGIAALGRARSLLKAGRADAAVAEYDRIAEAHAGDLDSSGLPIDLVARLQAAIVLRDAGEETAAAERLTALLDLLLRQPWTFGGYGETAIATRVLTMLEGEGMARLLRDASPPDLAAARRRLAARTEQQAEEAAVLCVVPAVVTAGRGEAHAATFALLPVRSGEREALVAHRWWSRSAERRQLVVLLDDRAVKTEVEASIAMVARANPEFMTGLVAPGEVPPPVGAGGFRVMQALDPWLPGYSVSVVRGAAVLGSARAQQRFVRLGMIAALLIIILTGIAVIARAVSREVEIARLKSDFVSSVSHELRTPLTTIRIMAEMLALGAVPSGEKQAEYHRNIVSEAERLTRLINNVLDFARIEEGRKKFQFGMGDISDAVYEVERITGDYVRKEGFELSTDVDGSLPATAFDRDAIIQALINLMSNAVKYSGKDRRIEMGARSEDDDNQIVLWVQDHGPGIDPKEVPHLFEKFYRGGDHMTREIGGTGLGLSIVQHIVAAHGGGVVVKSKLGEGSRFEIVLPVRGLAQQSDGKRG